MIFHPQTQSGFTLVETLVAITILLIVITGPLTITTSAARSTSFSSEQVVAFFLAQEGAEIMQKVREDASIGRIDSPSNPTFAWSRIMSEDDSGPNEGPYYRCFATNGCGLELIRNAGTIVVSTQLDCRANGRDCDLLIGPNDADKYTHIPGVGHVPSGFTRIIKLTTDPSNDAVRVESIVTWRTNSQRVEQEVKVETYLYNIY